MNVIAHRTIDLLIERKVLLYDDRTIFYIWKIDDRVLVIFDTTMIDIGKLNDDFAHRLSTRLQGRRVVRTNSRGLYLQIASGIPLGPQSLEVQSLDLNKQTTPWHIPIGITKRGPMWISFTEGDSYLIGGSRGGGKTGEEHGWVQALLHGNGTQVYAWDGKRGAEFGRYVGRDKFHLLYGTNGLAELEVMLKEREAALTGSGYPNIMMFNEASPEQIMDPVALFVDEAADLPDQAKQLLESMIRLYRHVGLYPVITTNQPTVAGMFGKTNLSTRIAFRVPHHSDSVTMLGYKGAEALPDIRGRGLIVWQGRFTEFQSYEVTYPMPASDVMKDIAKQQAAAEQEPPNEIVRLADSILDEWHPDMSKRAVGRLLGKTYAGAWAAKIDQIIEYLDGATTTTNVLVSGHKAG